MSTFGSWGPNQWQLTKLDPDDLQIDDIAQWDWPEFQLWTDMGDGDYWQLDAKLTSYDCAKGWPGAGPDLAYKRPDGTFADLPKIGSENPGTADLCTRCSNQLRCMVGGRPRFNPVLAEVR